MTMDVSRMALVGGAALLAGAVNAIAGGGSLLTFPALVAAGLPPVVASATNTLALTPGYLGATIAQRKDLKGQGRRAALLLPVGAAGGVAGAWLLLHTGERAFAVIVPFLLLGAALLVAGQDALRRRLASRVLAHRAEVLAVAPVALASIYGGYFGAGMGVMALAAVGVVLDETLHRLNAFKHALAFTCNSAAAIIFLLWGPIDWSVVGVMAVCALAGGAIGGAISGRIPARALRGAIVAFGLVLSVVYFAKL